ncbi:MAG TPA: hypothetical protein VFV87_07590 [Pirellulaceae bacterium]|nr:hypothetical protein [Pirellulaceae bacterium]
MWAAFRSVARWLEERQFSYAEIDHLAMFHHGFREYSEQVVLLVERPALEALRAEFGHSSVAESPWTFIEPETGVPVIVHSEIALSNAEPIRLVDLATGLEAEDGLRFIGLADLVSLKLAARRVDGAVNRGVAEVQQLILALCLTQEFGSTLHAAARESYRKICSAIDASCGNYLLLWESGEEVSQAPTFDELISASPAHSDKLRDMQRDGVTIFSARPSYKGRALLSTNNRAIARKYDMHHESEYLFSDELEPANGNHG